MKTIEIDRSKWRCGGEGASAKGKGETELLNAQGYMCCLGQMMLKGYKVPKKLLLGATIPEETGKVVGPLTRNSGWLEGMTEDTPTTDKAMAINDRRELTQKQREQELRTLFREENIDLKFVGRTVKHDTACT